MLGTTSTFLPPFHAPKSSGTGSQGWHKPRGAGDSAHEVVAKWLRSGSLGRRGSLALWAGWQWLGEQLGAAGEHRELLGAGHCR